MAGVSIGLDVVLMSCDICKEPTTLMVMAKGLVSSDIPPWCFLASSAQSKETEIGRCMQCGNRARRRSRHLLREPVLSSVIRKADFGAVLVYKSLDFVLILHESAIRI